MSIWVILLGPNQLGHASFFNTKVIFNKCKPVWSSNWLHGAKQLGQNSFNTLDVILRPDQENPEFVLKKSNTLAKDIRQYFVLFVQKL